MRRPIFALPPVLAPVLAVVAGLSLAASPTLAQVNIPTVPIGNPGNAADSTGFGSVAYSYGIGRTEVTNAQYAEFLNNVAYDDPNGLYDGNMASSTGGITRSGFIGAFFYSTVPGRANNPVNFVSFWDAARFANWLHNGQPTGPQNASTTEGGAYTLTPTALANNIVTRNAGWRWAVTSENEWYKAAYHQPASQGGDGDNYWLYPTSSNTIAPAQANYTSAIGNTTPVGSYAANFYGAFDMAGNLWEWNEAVIMVSARGLRGGSFGAGDINLRPDARGRFEAPIGGASFGFRLVRIPPPVACSIADIVGGDGNPPADGSVDGNDFQAFLNAFGSGDPLADIVGGDGNPPADGSVDGNDFQAFLNAFAAGC